MSLGSLGIGAAGLAGAFDADAPPERSYFDEMDYALLAQKTLAPKWLAAEREFAPQWNDVFLQNLRDVLGEDGLTELFGEQIAPFLRGLESGDRESAVADAERLAPRINATARAGNPRAAALLDALLESSTDELDDGMTAGELRDVQQAIRGAQADRGVGFGPRDTWEEVYGVGLESRALRERSRDQALKALLASQSFYQNPLAAILSMRSGTAAMGAAVPQIALSRTGQVFQPESSYLGAIKGQQYATQAGINSQNANLRSQYAKMTAGGIDSVIQGAIAAYTGGAGLGGGGGSMMGWQ